MKLELEFTIRRTVAIAIGIALFFLLARFAASPIFANTNISLQYAILASFAAVFGPIAGLAVGLMGHVLANMAFGYGIWWSWVISSALVGAASGFLLRGIKIDEGEFGNKAIIQFAAGNLIIHLIAWVVVAPVLDILIYSEPASKVFMQGLAAGMADFAVAAVIGSLLLIGYSKARVKFGNL
jgi:energy-coupling factor transport system substrate-specific component